MRQRGRPSAEALEIEAMMMPTSIDRTARQKPPHDLSDEACEIWVSVVNSEPADWFSPATVPLLAQFCRHCVQARFVAELIEKTTNNKKATIGDLDKLFKMQQRETATIMTLATKMRLSQQSVTNHRGNKKSHETRTSARPWEREPEVEEEDPNPS